jgi:hypothetical protein
MVATVGVVTLSLSCHKSKWVLDKLKPQGLKGLELAACAQMLSQQAHAQN